ncbi:MAG TPA: glycosyltransferase family 1 protein, partial [Candidatus Dormibacteraeota bacterium]|nr:glycosyltransferase family 1 protein [Candidatus Dormibacteraeota bacterium]
MSVLKVAWDNCFARRNETGTGVYAARLLDQFIHRPDLSIGVFDGPASMRSEKTMLRAVQTAEYLLWTHARLPAILRKGGFDLLHAPAFIAPIKSPCPLVITIHDVMYLLYPSHFSRWWVTYMKTVMPLVVRSAAAIICGSEHSKRDIVKAYGLPPDKIHTIPYGVEHQRFHPAATLDTAWTRALGIRDGYLLHVGALAERKNIPTLLRAIANLRSRGKWGTRQLVLAGSAAPGMTGAAAVYETIRQLDLASSVVLAGHVPDEHVPGLYAHASALIMPSLYEGFGFPVLESMSSGTPVITSNTSSLPEVAGDAALLVPPHDEQALADAIAEIIECRTTAEELRTKGLQRARQFSWER